MKCKYFEVAVVFPWLVSMILIKVYTRWGYYYREISILQWMNLQNWAICCALVVGIGNVSFSSSVMSKTQTLLTETWRFHWFLLWRHRTETLQRVPDATIHDLTSGPHLSSCHMREGWWYFQCCRCENTVNTVLVVAEGEETLRGRLWILTGCFSEVSLMLCFLWGGRAPDKRRWSDHRSLTCHRLEQQLLYKCSS